MYFQKLLSIFLLLGIPPVSSLSARFEQLAAKGHGRVGAAAVLIETGEAAGIRTREKFPMMSVVKLPVAMAVLRGVEQGKISLDRKILIQKQDLALPGTASIIRDEHPKGNFEMSVRELLRVMLDVSDNTACDVLLGLVDGPAGVTGYLRTIGVRDMVVANSEKQMARNPALMDGNWSTPEGALDLLRILHKGAALSAPNRDLVLQYMAESKTGARRIKGLLPPGTVVSHKTGTSSTRTPVIHALNDVGIVTLPNGKHLAIAVFVSRAKAGEASCERVIAEIAKSAWNHYFPE